MAKQPYSEEFLQKVDAFVARQRKIDRKIGAFASGEAHKAYDEGRLEEWFAEVSA